MRILNASRRIGLNASKHNILLPRKSVTAIIGVITGESQKKISNNYKNKRYRDDKKVDFTLEVQHILKEKNKISKFEFEKKFCSNCLVADSCELRRKGIYCGANK